MKNLATILIISVIVLAIWYFFGNRIKEMLGFSSVDAIRISASEMNIDSPDQSIIYKGKEYKFDHNEGSVNVDGKDVPLYFVYGNSIGSSAKVVLGLKKIKQRPTCSTEVTLSDGKYTFYAEDENWCLYSKI